MNGSSDRFSSCAQSRASFPSEVTDDDSFSDALQDSPLSSVQWTEIGPNTIGMDQYGSMRTPSHAIIAANWLSQERFSEPHDGIYLKKRFDRDGSHWLEQGLALQPGEKVYFDEIKNRWQLQSETLNEGYKLNASRKSNDKNKDKIETPAGLNATQCFIEAFNCKALNVEALQVIKSRLSPNGQVEINGIKFNKKRLTKQIKKINHELARLKSEYSSLQRFTDTDQQDYLLSLRTLTRALTFTPKSYALWLELGEQLGFGETVNINGKNYDKMTCLAAAVKYQPNCAEAWHTLGNSLHHTLSDQQTVTIEGEPIDSRGALTRSLELDPTLAPAWNDLSVLLNENDPRDTAAIGGQFYTKVMCLEKCISLDPKNSFAWLNFGLAVSSYTASDSELAYSSKVCFETAIETNPDNFRAWSLLARVLKTSKEAGNTPLGKLDWIACYAQALRITKDDADFCKVLGDAASLLAKDQTVYFQRDGIAHYGTALSTAIDALNCNPHYAIGWLNLGFLITRGDANGLRDQVRIGSNWMDANACFSKALELNSSMFAAWFNLGVSLEGDETRAINGQHFDRIDCFSHACELEPGNLDAWILLSQALTDTMMQRNGTVSDRSLTPLECCDAAQNIITQIDPPQWLLSLHYQQFANALPENEIVTIDEKPHDKTALYLKALEHDSANEQTWTALLESPTLNAAFDEKLCTLHNPNLVSDTDVKEIHQLIFLITHYDKQHSGIWYRLGNLLKQANTDVTIGNTDYSYRKCFANALVVSSNGAFVFPLEKLERQESITSKREQSSSSVLQQPQLEFRTSETVEFKPVERHPIIRSQSIYAEVESKLNSYMRDFRAIPTIQSHLEDLLRNSNERSSTVNLFLKLPGYLSTLSDAVSQLLSLMPYTARDRADALPLKELINLFKEMLHQISELKTVLNQIASTYSETRLQAHANELLTLLGETDLSDFQLSLTEKEALTDQSIVDCIFDCALQGIPFVTAEIDTEEHVYRLSHEGLLQWWQNHGGQGVNPLTRKPVEQIDCYALMPQDILLPNVQREDVIPFCRFDFRSSDVNNDQLAHRISRTLNKHIGLTDTPRHNTGRDTVFDTSKLLIAFMYERQIDSLDTLTSITNTKFRANQLFEWVSPRDHIKYPAKLVKKALSFCQSMADNSLESYIQRSRVFANIKAHRSFLAPNEQTELNISQLDAAIQIDPLTILLQNQLN